MPFDNDLSKKFDFNDLLNKQDEQAINKCLSKSIDVGDLSSFSNKSSALSQYFIKIQNQKQFNAKKFVEKDILVISQECDQQLL